MGTIGDASKILRSPTAIPIGTLQGQPLLGQFRPDYIVPSGEPSWESSWVLTPEPCSKIPLIIAPLRHLLRKDAGEYATPWLTPFVTAMIEKYVRPDFRGEAWLRLPKVTSNPIAYIKSFNRWEYHRLQRDEQRWVYSQIHESTTDNGPLTDDEQLTHVARTVGDDRVLASEYALDDVIEQIMSQQTMARLHQVLTDRQFEIADLLSRGYRQAEIARELHITIWTVRDHIDSIAKKLRRPTT